MHRLFGPFVKNLARVALSGGLMGFLLFHQVDGARVAALMQTVDVRFFAIVCGLKIAQIALGAERWRLVMAGSGQSAKPLFVLRLFWISAFFAQFLPGAVGGDVVRAGAAARAGFSLGQAARSVLLERAVSLGGLIALVAITSWTPAAATLPGKPFFLALAMGALGGGVCAWAFDWFGFRTLCAHPRYALGALFWGVVGPLNLALCAALLAAGMGLSLSFSALCVVIPAATLVASLPLSLAGWGVREAAFVAGLGFLGVGGEAAMGLSLLYGLAGLLASLPGAALVGRFPKP